MPVPLGKNDLPTRLSITELFPELFKQFCRLATNFALNGNYLLTCDPKTIICGKCIASDPTVLNTSCNLLITGIRASIVKASTSHCHKS